MPLLQLTSHYEISSHNQNVDLSTPGAARGGAAGEPHSINADIKVDTECQGLCHRISKA